MLSMWVSSGMTRFRTIFIVTILRYNDILCGVSHKQRETNKEKKSEIEKAAVIEVSCNKVTLVQDSSLCVNDI